MKYGLTLLFLLLFRSGFAQNPPSTENRIYDEFVKTVMISNDSLLITDPVIELNSGEKLNFSFDDLKNDFRQFDYTVIHCTKDWEISDLDPMDYIEGFQDQTIENYKNSSSTFVPYLHYYFNFPNEEIKLLYSGNYILYVYEEVDSIKPILTQRFYVLEQKLDIEADVRKASNVKYSYSHQEVSFEVNYKNFPLRNVYNDIWTSVRQNFRYDNEILDIDPKFVRDNKLIFEDAQKLVFPALKEYRYMDVRSLTFKNERMAILDNSNRKNYIQLIEDKSRSFKNYTFSKDINGKRVIDLSDPSFDKFTEADYAEVEFVLDASMMLPDSKVYVAGEWTNYSTSPEYEMFFEADKGLYKRKIFLKQGYYNYMYGTIEEETRGMDFEFVEGNDVSTENDYQIFIYFSPPGFKYDRLIGYSSVNSNE